MTDISHLPDFTEEDVPEHITLDEAYANRFTEGVLEQHKREGLELAVRARWIGLAIIAVMLPFLNMRIEVLYYEVMLLVVAGIGWLQRRYGRVGRSNAELAVMALDLSVMVFILVMPNPFTVNDWPTAMIYRFENFQFLFVILAVGTISYSWRTVAAIGTWTAGLWTLAFVLVWLFGVRDPELSVASAEAYPDDPLMAWFLDPNQLNLDLRLQQVVIFVVVAFTLAVSVRRFNRLLLGNAALERERENLARYFSPNVVEKLSRNDDPLKEIRSHDVAVIFVDIKGFTTYAASRDPEEVIQTLRSFHALMERAVFAQDGTLDKFLGDGLMATFGSPLPRPDDVRRAYHCSRRMVDLAADWNAQRLATGQEALGVSIGVHYGPVVLGDIGGNRLEYTAIGNTVNVASRLEALTRPLGARLIVSQDVYRRLPEEEVQDLERVDGQTIRGLDGQITVWRFL